jgi:tRNA(Glu) U13 pseudouridine synthase TruD
MDRRTKRQVVVALLRARRRDLAVQVVASHFATILMSKPVRKMRAIITPVLKKHRVWYRYSGGAGEVHGPHFSVEFRDRQQNAQVTRELTELLEQAGFPLGLEIYDD